MGQHIGNKGDTAFDVIGKEDNGVKVGAKISPESIYFGNVDQSTSPCSPPALQFP